MDATIPWSFPIDFPWAPRDLADKEKQPSVNRDHKNRTVRFLANTHAGLTKCLKI